MTQLSDELIGKLFSPRKGAEWSLEKDGIVYGKRKISLSTIEKCTYVENIIGADYINMTLAEGAEVYILYVPSGEEYLGKAVERYIKSNIDVDQAHLNIDDECVASLKNKVLKTKNTLRHKCIALDNEKISIKKENDPFEKIEKLKKLLDMGAISQKEYDAKKMELIDKI